MQVDNDDEERIESNRMLQMEEIEMLKSIYGEEQIQIIKQDTPSSLTLRIHFDDWMPAIHILIHLPSTYPSHDCPVVEYIHTPWTVEEKLTFEGALKTIHQNAQDQVYLYTWLENVRDSQDNNNNDDDTKKGPFDVEEENAVMNLSQKEEHDASKVLHEREEIEIVHGHPITDRKSTFQAHVAPATCLEQVKEMQRQLLCDRKIQRATHNMLAYRFQKQGSSFLEQDYDDDGESGAGMQLLSLLECSKAMNVVCVVSRWYGGIHLGPVRFKHIKNAAKSLLEQYKDDKS